MPRRFQDPGHDLDHWADSIEVCCPSCQAVALVTYHPEPWSAEFLCPHCTRSFCYANDCWYGPWLGYAKRRCGHCGQRLTAQKVFSQRPSQAKAQVRCSACQANNQLSLELSRLQTRDHALDPFFGLPLALQEATRWGTLWAYNLKHLADLKRYINAELRETSALGKAYFNRLPAWIKAAKSRSTLLRVISRLEQRQLTQRTLSRK